MDGNLIPLAIANRKDFYFLLFLQWHDSNVFSEVATNVKNVVVEGFLQRERKKGDFLCTLSQRKITHAFIE